MKIKAAMELDILRCGYFWQLATGNFFVLFSSLLAYLHWLSELKVCPCLFNCLNFSNFTRQRKITLVSSSPCCNLKRKYLLDFWISKNLYIGNFHRRCLERVLLDPYKQKMKMPYLISNASFCLSHLIKRVWLMFSLKQHWLDFSYFQCSLFNHNYCQLFLSEPETKMKNVYNTWHRPPLSNVKAWSF